MSGDEVNPTASKSIAGTEESIKPLEHIPTIVLPTRAGNRTGRHKHLIWVSCLEINPFCSNPDRRDIILIRPVGLIETDDGSEIPIW